MSRRVLLIYNPNAGLGKVRTQISGIAEILSAHSDELILYPTGKRGDAYERALQYARKASCDYIVCAGGDGTLSETVNGVMCSGASVPVGFIPAGTTNDFGSSLSLPKDMQHAAEKISRWHEKACDVGSLGKRYFTYTAAFGLFTDVAYQTPQNVKNVLGRAAYLMEGATRLSAIKPIPVKATLDDGQVFEEEVIFGAVSNTKSLGGFKGITGKNVSLSDGYMELMLVKMPKNVMELGVTLTELTHGEFSGLYTHMCSVKEVTIHTKQPLAWTLDGEFGGESTDAHILVHKRAIIYLC